jgi:hypothetical protein
VRIDVLELQCGDGSAGVRCHVCKVGGVFGEEGDGEEPCALVGRGADGDGEGAWQ